jgi:hypothetical protein
MARATESKETLDDFIVKHEDAAQGADLVVTRVVFPGAPSRVYPGRYAGIVVEDGKEVGATYSDGSKHA